MADNDNSPTGISEETKGMLEDHVKKGKARKFILIYKGASIKTLIVFKKGPYGPKITQAKKAGFKGTACIGVITGKGVNITFQLPGNADVSGAMKTEGNVYEGEPCKVAKLRKFFVEEAELKFKPEFQVITQTSDVTAVSELDDGQEEDDQAESVVDTINEDQKQKLVEALKKLTPMISQAVANRPQEKGDIMAPVTEIKGLLQANNLDDAKTKIISYADYLKTIVAEQTEDTGSSVPPPPPPTEENAKENEWNWRSKELTPKLKKVLAEKLGDFAQVAAEFKLAKAAKDSDIDSAVEHLKKCAELVEAALKDGEGDWEDTTDQDYLNAWNDVSKDFPAQRQRVASALPDKVSEFDQLVSQANDLASNGDHKAAVELALKAAELDTEAKKSETASELGDTIPEHVVEDRKKFLMSRWQDAVKASYIEVEKLAAPIASQVPDEDPQQLISGINDALDDFVDEFNTAIMGAQSATPKDMRPLDRAMEAISSYRSKISSDPLIAQLDQAKGALGVDIKVSEQLLKALDELETRLAG